MVIGGTNEEICFSGANIDEEHPGRFGRVQNCRLDIEGTLWEVGICDAVKNRALTSVRVSGLHRAGVRLKPKIFFSMILYAASLKLKGRLAGCSAGYSFFGNSARCRMVASISLP